MILFFHGNAGSLADWGYLAEEIVQKTSFDVWMMDYPGYGKSSGVVRSENQLHDLGGAFMREAQTLAAGKRTLIFGRSIGSGIATKLASEFESAGLILESPYVSMARLLREKIWWVPSFLLKYPLRSDEWIVRIKVPVLILHGKLDEIIPMAQGEALSKLGAKTQFVVIPEGHHNDLRHFPSYWPSLVSFLGEL